MKDKFVLKPCPHCGGEATLASPDQWSYLSCIVFCPSCLAKGPQEKKWTGTLKKGFNVVMDEVEPFDLFYRKK